MDYDGATHTYSDNGVIIPSVTQILYPAPSGPWFTKESSDRGHEAHALCAAYARDPTYFPAEKYVDAFALWCFKWNPQWLAIEEMIDGKVDGFRFSGRFDGLAMIEGLRTLIDWKTGVRSAKFRAQLGGYSLVAKPARACLLYLRDDMTWKEQWLPSSQLVQGIQEFRGAIKDYYAQKN
jgi:hypothetical protein